LNTLQADQRPVTVCRGREFRWGSRTYVMGIINVTPDSFSGDGLGNGVDAALAQALRFEEEGADILDVGGHSTRPGHTPITQQEELRRVVPVIERLARETSLPISIDTFVAQVALRAFDYGASMVNDQWALRHDPEMAGVVAEAGVPIVLMHNQHSTEYSDLIPDISASLKESVAKAQQAGIPLENIIVDPGLGFGKTLEHNLEVVRRLSELTGLASALLVGPSRKSMIGRVLGLPVDQRGEGTGAVLALSIANGADMVRVHDVKEMVRVCRMTDAIVRGLSAQQP
ncbi:MAG: dihydropteroate synthase, partial [Dehalococcoidia bacterium]